MCPSFVDFGKDGVPLWYSSKRHSQVCHEIRHLFTAYISILVLIILREEPDEIPDLFIRESRLPSALSHRKPPCIVHEPDHAEKSYAFFPSVLLDKRLHERIRHWIAQVRQQT